MISLFECDTEKIAFTHFYPEPELSGGEIGKRFPLPAGDKGDFVAVKLFHISEAVTGDRVTVFVANFNEKRTAGTGGNVEFQISSGTVQHFGKKCSAGGSGMK